MFPIRVKLNYFLPIRRSSFFLIATFLLIFPVSCSAHKDCGVPEFSANQIHKIIKKERKSRDDLPPPFPKYDYNVSKKGCYYTYIETKLPKRMHQTYTFRLNRKGLIVSVQGGDAFPIKINCPKKVYSQEELAEIIKSERELRKDLPKKFIDYKVNVLRSVCLYDYFEVELPEKSGDILMFTIDGYGELMKFYYHKRKNTN